MESILPTGEYSGTLEKVLSFLLSSFQGIIDITSMDRPILILDSAVGSQLEAKLDKKTDEHWYCSLVHDWYWLWINDCTNPEQFFLMELR
jgi:hypothetical protein